MKIKECLFNKTYRSLRNQVSYFFHSKIPFISPMWNEFKNPWYHWWKARKYFKCPRVHFLFKKNFWTFGLPIKRDYYNPMIDINFYALGWKDKWDSPRHERDPMICITFFRTWYLLWIFNWVVQEEKYSHIRSMATWEAILDYSRYNKSIDQVIDTYIWNYKENGEKNITIIPNMTKKGLQKYKFKHIKENTEIEK